MAESRSGHLAPSTTSIRLQCPVTHYSRLSGLKQNSFTISMSSQKSRHGVTGFSARGLTRLRSYRGWAAFLPESSREGSIFKAHSDCCLDLVPHGCRMEITVSQLAVSWGSLSITRVCLHSLPWGSLHLQSWHGASPRPRIPLTLLISFARKRPAPLKGSAV